MKGFVVEPDDAVGTERGGNGHGGEHRPPPPRASASWLLRIGALVVLAAAAAWAYYANVYSAKPAMDMNMRVSAGDAAFPIVAAAVERAPVSGVVTYTGTVAPFNEEDIFPRVTGRIVEMPVYPGDAVRAGQVVARLDDVELTSRVREAEAMAATAQANRAQMEADVTASGHGVVQMEQELAMVEAELRVRQRRDRGRTERLCASGAISRQEYENDRSMAAGARGQARGRPGKARAGAGDGDLRSDGSSTRPSRWSPRVGRPSGRRSIVRDYVSIVAPTSGYVVKRLVAPGVLVQPGMAILKIAQVDRVRLQANVGEKDIALDPGRLAGDGDDHRRARPPHGPRDVRLPVRRPGTADGGGGGDRGQPGSPAPPGPVRDDGVRDRRARGGDHRSPRRGRALGGAGHGLGGERGSGRAAGGDHGARRQRARGDRPGLTGSERVVARGHEGLYAGARVSERSRPPPAGHAGHDSASGGSEAGGNATDPAVEAGPGEARPKEDAHAWH